MSADKYLSIFSNQMEAIVYYAKCSLRKIQNTLSVLLYAKATSYCGTCLTLPNLRETYWMKMLFWSEAMIYM